MSDDNSKKRLGRGLAALMGDLDKPIDSGSDLPIVGALGNGLDKRLHLLTMVERMW